MRDNLFKHISDKDLISKYTKNSHNMNNQTTWSKIRQRVWNGHFSKDIQIANRHMKSCLSQEFKSVHNEISLYTCQNGYYQKDKKTIHVFEDVERRELSWTTDRNVNWYSHYGKQYRDSSKKNCNYYFVQQLSGIYPMKRKTPFPKKIIHSYIHCSNSYNNQEMKQPKCPSTDDWIKYTGCVCVCVCV